MGTESVCGAGAEWQGARNARPTYGRQEQDTGIWPVKQVECTRKWAWLEGEGGGLLGSDLQGR